MFRWTLALSFLIALLPASAAAQSPVGGDGDSVLIRINADVTIAADETADNLVVISGNANIEGTVTGSLLVIDGDATISGTVADDVVVIAGDVSILDGATVGNVSVIRGDVTQAEGATVTGDVEERDLTGLWAALGVFSVLFWIGMTVAAIVAGILFALIGGRQLAGSAILMTADAVSAIVGAVFVAIALPVLAVIVMLTVIGLPLGLGMLIFLLPAVFFLGYLVAATRFGMLITGAMNRDAGDRPVLAAVLGVLILQVVLIIPFLGGLVVFLASLWGSGALVAYAFRAARGRRAAETPPPAAA